MSTCGLLKRVSIPLEAAVERRARQFGLDTRQDGPPVTMEGVGHT